MSVNQVIDERGSVSTYCHRTDAGGGAIRTLDAHAYDDGELTVRMNVCVAHGPSAEAVVRLTGPEAEFVFRAWAKRRGLFLAEQSAAPAYVGAGDDDKAGADAPGPVQS